MEEPDMKARVLNERLPRDRQTYAIIGAAMEVHRVLGPGFLEPVYPVHYKDVLLGLRYRVDFLGYDDILVELKALERMTKREESQVIHYLLASRISRGILLDFGAPSLQYRRLVGPTHKSASKSVQSVESVGSVE
jgi:hypothetical protein